MDAGKGSADAVRRIVSGAYNMGFPDINALIQFNSKNPDRAIQEVMMGYEQQPFSIFTLKTSKITHLKQLVGLNSIPKVAVVPILVIWFGGGVLPLIITAFVLSFFPIVVNVAAGLATIEPELRVVLRALGANERDVLFKVGFPRSLPFFFASLKIAVALAFVGAEIAETVAGNQGVGHVMLIASSNFDTPLMFAGLIVIAVMAIGMYAIFAAADRHFTGWATRSMDYATGG